MGTNYYHERDGYEGAKCARCGGFCSNCEAEARVHIGKSSAGWTFSFQATPTIHSYQNWLRELALGGIIRDEYGEVVSLDDFKQMVENKQKPWGKKADPPLVHAAQYPSAHDFLDAEGHSFSSRDFS